MVSNMAHLRPSLGKIIRCTLAVDPFLNRLTMPHRIYQRLSHRRHQTFSIGTACYQAVYLPAHLLILRASLPTCTSLKGMSGPGRCRGNHLLLHCSRLIRLWATHLGLCRRRWSLQSKVKEDLPYIKWMTPPPGTDEVIQISTLALISLFHLNETLLLPLRCHTTSHRRSTSSQPNRPALRIRWRILPYPPPLQCRRGSTKRDFRSRRTDQRMHRHRLELFRPGPNDVGPSHRVRTRHVPSHPRD